MILSEDRQSHLAHVIIDGIWKDDMVDYTDDGSALRVAKKVINDYVVKIDNVDDLVRKKIMSLKRTVIERTPEWDILYNKYFEEEMNRRG